MENVRDLIQRHILESITVKQKLAEEQADLLVQISKRLTETLQANGTIYLCGNGGSAADAQHVASELVGKYLRERQPLSAIALTTNTSILTSIGNDYDFFQIFARQVYAMVTPRDALVGISTSGKSFNVLLAVRAAREIGALTVGFTGMPGQPLASETDICLRVSSSETPRIQEAHILAWHIICDLIERSFSHAA